MIIITAKRDGDSLSNLWWWYIEDIDNIISLGEDLENIIYVMNLFEVNLKPKSLFED